jgi:hypothetical protein
MDICKTTGRRGCHPSIHPGTNWSHRGSCYRSATRLRAGVQQVFQLRRPVMCEVELYPDRAYMCSNWRIATCTVQEHAIVYSQFLDCAYQTGIWLYMNCFFYFFSNGDWGLAIFSLSLCLASCRTTDNTIRSCSLWFSFCRSSMAFECVWASWWL